MPGQCDKRTASVRLADIGGRVVAFRASLLVAYGQVIVTVCQPSGGRRMHNQFHGEAQVVVQAEAIYGGINTSPSEPVRPAQLPPVPELFVDREEERERLHAVLARESVAGRAKHVVISGPSGSGKSALAVRWLHDVLSRYSDGQVYFDFHARHRSVDPVELAQYCLRSIGVGGGEIPETLHEAVALLRTRTHGRRYVFVFDNLPDSRFLRALQLSAADILVVATSQHSAAGVEGVEALEIGALDAGPALSLLAEACGHERLAAEPAAADRIVRLCGRMPIALRVVAARLAQRPEWTLERLVRQLSDENRRLSRMSDGGETVVWNTLDFAYTHLSAPQAELYRLLGTVPGVSFCVEAVAALTDWDVDDAEDILFELRSANLVQRDDHDQYRFHDLVRLHARAFDVDDETALHRLAFWYREQGAFAERAVMGASRLRVAGDEQFVAGRENPYDHDSGLRWLEREQLNLLAIVRECSRRNEHPTVISLCDSPLWALHNQHKHYRDMLEALELAVRSAHDTGHLVAEARMRTLRVRIHMELGGFDAAHEEAATAVRLAESSGHRTVFASALEFHGKVYLEQGAFDAAIPLFERAADINRELGDGRGLALQQHFLGRALDGLGEHETALRVLSEALERISDFPGDRRTPARIRVSLGKVHQNLGNHERAIEFLNVAMTDMIERGVSFDLVQPLELLANSLEATGDPAPATAYRERAESLRAQASPEA